MGQGKPVKPNKKLALADKLAEIFDLSRRVESPKPSREPLDHKEWRRQIKELQKKNYTR